VYGVEELAAEIYQARGQKPVVAVANSLAASASYWIAASADELVVTPSGEVGSIGVFAMHEDMSGLMEQMGVRVSLISAGKHKTETNPFEPLTDEARAALQEQVDGYYEMFVRAVARGRGVGVADVRGGFGEGRLVGAKEAVRLGMADRVETMEQTIGRLSRRHRNGRSAAADLDFRRRRLRVAER
jgi:signal peptide peptidase SppA